MSKHLYIAMTTHNEGMSGYNIILAAGNKKNDVLAKARGIIGDIATEYGTDIYKDTEHKNLIVVSKTRAKKEYGFDWNEFFPDYSNPINRFEMVS